MPKLERAGALLFQTLPNLSPTLFPLVVPAANGDQRGYTYFVTLAVVLAIVIATIQRSRVVLVWPAAVFASAMSAQRTTPLASALLMIVGVSLVAPVQERPSPATLIEAQRDAMVRLAYMDGMWRGPAWTILSSSENHTITQKERIGPSLDGSVKVRGRGYDPDGKATCSAMNKTNIGGARWQTL